MRELAVRKNTRNDIITSQSTVQYKPRSPQELTARYNLKREQYKELKMTSDSPETREQLVMIYSEVKVLGWALGKDEKTIIKEMSF
ncbi:MAG: hypothetical protein J6M62_01635 [Selenomonadaceae bacterium]|nr:hypothetical protein [Selenomonadaceae bacterium]